MKNIVIIQARMNSSRLPGKVLLKLAGYPLIDHVVYKALKIPNIDEIHLATTKNPKDDELCNYVLSKFKSLSVFRGSEENVLERYISLLEKSKNSSANVVRITADDPLRDPLLQHRALDILDKNKNVSCVFNGQNPAFPLGIEVEVFRASDLIKLKNVRVDSRIKEHVFPIFKEGYFGDCYQIKPQKDYSNISLTIDTISDFLRIEDVILKAASSLQKNPLEVDWQSVSNFNQIGVN